MTTSRFRRWLTRHFATPAVPGEREIWVENTGQSELRIMLEPWCDIYDIPVGHHAKLVGQFEDELDEFVVQYDPDNYLGIYCPYETKVTIIEDRFGLKSKS